VSWNFHSLAPGAHPEEAIDIIGSLGFDGIELIANSRQDIDAYWTESPTIESESEGRRIVPSVQWASSQRRCALSAHIAAPV
jgi:hypothetical protein